MKLGKRFFWLVLAGFLAVGVAGALFIMPHYEGSAPTITLAKTPTHLGVSNKLDFQAADVGKGLSLVQVTLEQPGKSKLLLDQKYANDSIWHDGKLKSASFSLSIEPKKLGLADGPATLTLTVRDHSWRRAFHGNVTSKAFQILVDTKPPAVSVLNGTIYINRGGAGLAVYSTDQDAREHGVMVGDHLFPGFAPWPKHPKARLCYFAYPESEKKGAEVAIWAKDPAGNQTKVPLAVRLKWKAYRHDIMRVSDGFLESIVPRFASVLPPKPTDALSRYIIVNTQIRVKDNARARQAAMESGPYQLWNEKAFQRPMGKLMAGFGDRRRYMYKTKLISNSVHLGQDIASVKQAPIKAAASGVVRFAGDLGIYGNCVVLDHGQNVATLYGHLSSIAVTPGTKVKGGQQIAQSGSTGLSGGDHLHFSVLVGGVFVAPKEWWDPHWIQDNINHHLASAGLGLPTPPAAK